MTNLKKKKDIFFPTYLLFGTAIFQFGTPNLKLFWWAYDYFKLLLTTNNHLLLFFSAFNYNFTLNLQYFRYLPILFYSYVPNVNTVLL